MSCHYFELYCIALPISFIEKGLESVLPGSKITFYDHQPCEVLLGQGNPEEARKTKKIACITCILKPFVECSLKNPSPMIYLDACFCRNEGKLISALFMDANHHIQPIGCHFCGEETKKDYMLLLESLMNAGLKDRPYIVFNSDESAAIAGAIMEIKKKFPDITFKHVKCYQHISRHVAKEMVKEGINPKDAKQKEKYDAIMGSYWKARHAGTYELYFKYMEQIYELSPPIYNYILSKGEEQFLYSHPNHSHYSQETNNPCESFNARLKKSDTPENSIRMSDLYNTMYRWTRLSINMSVNRLKILKLHPPPDPESNDFPLPNPTWCQYIFKVLAQTGHDAVMMSGDVYKFIEEENRNSFLKGLQDLVVSDSFLLLCLTVWKMVTIQFCMTVLYASLMAQVVKRLPAVRETRV